MTLQKLVNRAIHLYLTDNEFKEQVDETNPILDNKKY